MEIKACRVCGNTSLEEIGSLGEIAISDFTDIPQEGNKYPLTLVYCEECTLLQLAHNTPRELLYKNYWYESHINPVIVNDLREIGELCEGEIHIDIGSNDNTLLKYSKAKIKIGIEPSNIKSTYRIDFQLRSYWEGLLLSERGKIDIITAVACLYDLPDPNKFIWNIKRHLAKDGVFIAQLMTLQPMIENNDIGNICHEHLEYYSYKSLTKLFEQNELEIFKVEKNNINGGSYRIFARHFKKGSIEYKEKEYTVEDMKTFFKRIDENRLAFTYFLTDLFHRLGGAAMYLCGYGASTKMNTMLQYYAMPNIPREIVDVNPAKIGKYTIGTGIPIVGEIPNWCEYLWVFPYGFLDYFREKEKNYKGKWVTTIPEFKVI